MFKVKYVDARRNVGDGVVGRGGFEWIGVCGGGV